MTLPQGAPQRDAFARDVMVVGHRPVRVVFGVGTLGQVAAEACALGDHILLISGTHEAASADLVSADLGGHLAGRVRGVAAHVPAEVAADAVAQARRLGVGVLVSLGGGSATGLAKAVARELDLPVLAVPTTYAGSEMTPIWGLTDAQGKTTGRDARVLPRTVVYDPVLTCSLPAAVTAASGMNALAHAVEALYAPDLTPDLAAVAEQALAALAAGLPGAVADGNDLRARTEALYGAWLAGWALGATTMGLEHKLAHVLGGTFRLPHAGVHSALLPQVAAFNQPAAPEAFSRAARALALADGDAVPAALFDLATRLSAPTSLAELGFHLDALDDVVGTVMSVPVTNPRPIRSTDLGQLLREAHDGHRPPAHPDPGGRP